MAPDNALEIPIEKSHMKTQLPSLLALLLFPAATQAQNDDLVSGPQKGATLGPVALYANSGPYAGQESFDASEEIGDGPGLFLFIQTLNRNTAPVIRGVDHLSAEYELFGLQSFSVTLNSDRTAAEEMLRRVNGSLKLRRPITLSLDGLEGPGSMALNRQATLTVVLVNNGSVTQSIALNDTGLHDLQRIREAIEMTIGAIPNDRSELLALAAQRLPEDPDELRTRAAELMVDLFQARNALSDSYENSRRYTSAPTRRNMNTREAMRPGTRPDARTSPQERPTKPETETSPNVRRGAAPTDPALNTALRSFIRQNATEAAVEEIFETIENRAETSDDLTQQSISMFQLMLSYPDRYGIPRAQELAKEFLKRHDAE